MHFFSLPKQFSLDMKWVGCHVTKEDFDYIPHSNPHYSLLVVSNGPIFLEHNSQKLTLKTGEMLLLGPWDVHLGWRDMIEGTDFAWMQFAVHPHLRSVTDEEARELALRHVQDEKSDLRTSPLHDNEVMVLPHHMLLRRPHYILSLYEQILYNTEHPKAFYKVSNTIILSQILLSIAEELLVLLNIEQSLSPSVSVYRKLVNYLEESYTSDIKRQQIESKMEMRYTYLCKIFKQYSGITIFTYIQELRIQLSKHLLESSKSSLQHIATQVGFHDQYYFSRCFTKYEGISPSQYRTSKSQMSSR